MGGGGEGEGGGGEGRLQVGKLGGEVGLMEECEALQKTQWLRAWAALMPWLWPLLQAEREREVLVYCKGGDRGWFIGADAGILCGFYWYVNKNYERRLGKWVFPYEWCVA